MKIGNFEINKGRTFIIAEIGGNHEGDFDCAKKMIVEAAQAGADAVKFQIFEAGKIISPNSHRPAYSGKSHKEQFERFRKLQFSTNQYRELKKLSDKNRVLFFASVFDQESVDIFDSLMPAYKVASGDISFYSLLKQIRSKKKPVIISTGASIVPEIKRVIKWIGKKDLVFLHCICSYPAPYEELNLCSIPYLQKKLGVPIGYSDHSIGIECAIAAVALGACVIEKHFTLDKSIPYGDHKLSVNPAELKQMVDSIRKVEKAVGSPGRSLQECEKRARNLVRRSLYAKKDLPLGHKISSEDLIALRPLDGIPAEFEASLIGKKMKKSLSVGEAIGSGHLPLSQK